MTFEEYQEKAKETAVYPNVGNNYIYPMIGLAGEVGEVANKVQKIIRDKNYVINEKDREELAKELGDVIWYISTLCFELGLSFEDVAEKNIEKLSSRKNREELSGSGDNR